MRQQRRSRTGVEAAPLPRPEAAARPPEPPVEPGPADPAGRLRSLLEAVGQVVAPTTLITVLLFYFGWAQTNAVFLRFGIDQSALGLTVQDYLLRSVNSTFRPLAVLMLVAVAGLSLHISLTRRPGTPRWWGMAAAVAGGLLLLTGLSGLWGWVRYRTDFPVIPLSLGAGLGLLAYGGHLRARDPAHRPASTAAPTALLATRRAVVGVFVTVMLFWSVAVYAQARGAREAEVIAASLHRRPDVTVYSAKRLHLEGADVQEVELQGPEGAYRFRYSGLKLVIRSAGKWFLLPAGWTPRRPGAAILLPDRDDLRVELAPGGPTGAAGSATR
jgi:hypothetical protein